MRPPVVNDKLRKKIGFKIKISLIIGCSISSNAPINVKPAAGVEGAGEGRAWGGDLIVFVGPGVGHLTDLVVPGEGIFESFFARRGDI